MAELDRKAIRQDVAARLAAAGIVPEGRVFGFRTTPLPANKLPALLVYVNGQADSSKSIAQANYRRTLDLAVECAIDGADDEGLGDAIDDLCAAIENALLTDAAWLGKFERVSDIRTDLVAEVVGDRRIAGAKLVFSLVFSARYPANLTAAPNLSTVALVVDTVPTDGASEATALYTLPEV